MKRVLQNGYNVFVTLFFLIVAVALLTGCPKKIAPVGKGSKTTPVQKGSVLGGAEKRDGSLEGGSPVPLKEEEIPALVKLEGPLESPALEALVPEERALALSALADIFFDFGQWTIRPAETSLFEKNIAWMNTHMDTKIEIEGHADSRGTNEYNLILGEKRAHAVQEYLVQLGIDQSRLLVVSYGEERPFCNREDEACYQENRRVHFRAE